MDLFGVLELPTSKSLSAPGWAYVPDTMSSAAPPAARKRARHMASAHDQTARQDAKIARDLAALEKEGGGRDVVIPVPVRARDGAGRGMIFLPSRSSSGLLFYATSLEEGGAG